MLSVQRWTLYVARLRSTTALHVAPLSLLGSNSPATGASSPPPRGLRGDTHSTASEETASRVREVMAISQALMPSRMGPSPMRIGARAFSSFQGSQPEFMQDVREGSVLVFFYKPVCGPCTTIRDKIKSATGRLAGADPTPAAAAVDEDKGSARQSDAQDPTLTVNGSDSEPSKAAADLPPALAWLNDDSDAAAAAAAVDAMTPQDHKVCVALREHLAGPAPRAAARASQRPLAASPSSAPAEPHGAARIRVLAVNTDENTKMTALHDVRSLPTFVGYHNGKIVGRAEGAHEDELLGLVHALRGLQKDPLPAQTNVAA